MTSIGKVRRAFDVNSLAQAAALASSMRRTSWRAVAAMNAEGLVQLERIMREHGLEPLRSVANFLFAEVGEDSRPLFEQLLREGVIVRPTGGFGGRDPRHRRHAEENEKALRRSARRRVLSRAALTSSIGEREAAVAEAAAGAVRADISGGTSSCSRRRAAADARS